jgi:hypothetical protein
MAQGLPGLDVLVRQAFKLIIEIRHTRGAARGLSLAVNFLRMLARNPDQDAPPFVFNFTVVPMRENHPGSAPKPSPREEG